MERGDGATGDGVAPDALATELDPLEEHLLGAAVPRLAADERVLTALAIARVVGERAVRQRRAAEREVELAVLDGDQLGRTDHHGGQSIMVGGPDTLA